MKKLLAFIIAINLLYYAKDVELGCITDSECENIHETYQGEPEPHCPPDEDCFETIQTWTI